MGKLTGKWTVRRVVVSVAVVVIMLVIMMVVIGLGSRAPHEGVILDVSVSMFDKLLPYEVVVKGSDGKLYTWNVSEYDAAGYALGMTLPLAERAQPEFIYTELHYLRKNGLSR